MIKVRVPFLPFVLLVIGYFTCGFQLAFITTHLPAYLVDRGLSTDNALMIALAAHLHPRAAADPIHLRARGHWRIHEPAI